MSFRATGASNLIAFTPAIPLGNCADDNWTMACWYIPDTTGTRYCMDVGNQTNSQGVRLGQNSTTILLNQVSSAGTTNRQASSVLTAGKWNHLACVMYGGTFVSGGLWILYCNGRRVGSGSGLSTGTYTTPTVTKIGCGTSASGIDAGFASGLIAEAGFWNRGLSQQEVLWLATGAPAVTLRAGMSFYLPMMHRKLGVQFGDLTKCAITNTNFLPSGSIAGVDGMIGHDPPACDEYDFLEGKKELTSIALPASPPSIYGPTLFHSHYMSQGMR